MVLKKVLLGSLIALILFVTYSHNLLDVPAGLTVDEASFGYNAALLAKTGHDQNGRFMPLFVLYPQGNDWRQPVTQYYLTSLFKIFGASVYLLRFSSVIIAVASVFGIYFLCRLFLDSEQSFVAAFFMALAPAVMIQSHMALDNIMPMPFVILWLYGLVKYKQKSGYRWLIISALALGISFYTYKGMRPVAPIWIIATFFWLFLDPKNKKSKAKDPLIFLTAVSPFFLIIPLIEHFYAGAILGGTNPVIHNAYDFFMPYLSSFDVSYLFVKGDIVEVHSTGRHGMLLLASAPLVFAGIYAAAKSKSTFIKLILISLFLGPLLYGTVGSVHRFSRLLSLIPLFAILVGLGFSWFRHLTSRWLKAIPVLILIMMALNFIDFYKYYLIEYPPLTFSLLGSLQNYRDIAQFAQEAKNRKLAPFIEKQIVTGGGESIKFFQVIYFGRILPTADDNAFTPKGTILLTNRKQIPNMNPIEEPHRVQYWIQVGIL